MKESEPYFRPKELEPYTRRSPGRPRTKIPEKVSKAYYHLVQDSPSPWSMVEEFYDEIGNPPREKPRWNEHNYRVAPKDSFRPIGKGNIQWVNNEFSCTTGDGTTPLPDMVAAWEFWKKSHQGEAADSEWPSAWLRSFRDFIYDIGRSRIEGVDGAGNTPLTLGKVDAKKPHGRGNTIWAPAVFR